MSEFRWIQIIYTNSIQMMRFIFIINIRTPKMDWYNYLTASFLLASSVERVKAEGWCIFGGILFWLFCPPEWETPCQKPKNTMIDTATAILGMMTKWVYKVGVLSFPHFGPREMIRLENKPKCFPGISQQAFLLMCF